MKDNFPGIFLTTVSPVIEGGYGNDKYDSGGPTNYGVIQSEYNAYRKKKGLPAQSVRFIALKEAREIYKLQYWDYCHCDDLPDGVDWMVFDAAVNSGPAQSVKWLQRAINDTIAGSKFPPIDVDGHIGMVTDQRCDDACYIDAHKLINRMKARRLSMLQHLSNWWRFGKGWTNRVNYVTEKSLAMVKTDHTEPRVPDPTFAPTAPLGARISWWAWAKQEWKWFWG